MRRGGSLLQTVALQVVPRADVSTVAFVDPKVLSNQTAACQEAFKDVMDYAAISGLDSGGANKVELNGGYHSSLTGLDKFERLTATVRDKDENRLYFYRRSDGTFWERIHIPRNSEANANLYEVRDDYVKITKAQFDVSVPFFSPLARASTSPEPHDPGRSFNGLSNG
ncbi:hypothetical protein B0H14DRAFT_2340477 [Mycena olivaceomarginata]|nr:hypothetical protein B0H14DRAFT_2340477 [Mycena olivaceomarginata]